MNVFRTLPAKHLEEIANQFRIHNINALLVIGGFEVCNIIEPLHLSSIFDPTNLVIFNLMIKRLESLVKDY